MKSSKIADQIIVSSDSEEMLQIAADMGVETIKRPIEFANESKPFSEFLISSPFLDEYLIQQTKKKYFEALQDGYGSLITIYKFKHYMLDSNEPLNYEMGLKHKNSQDLPALDFFTNGIIYAPIESIRK